MADLFISDKINKYKARKLGVLLLGSWVLPQGLRVSRHNRKNKKLEKRPERQTDSRQVVAMRTEKKNLLKNVTQLIQQDLQTAGVHHKKYMPTM